MNCARCGKRLFSDRGTGWSCLVHGEQIAIPQAWENVAAVDMTTVKGRHFRHAPAVANSLPWSAAERRLWQMDQEDLPTLEEWGRQLARAAKSPHRGRAGAD